MKLLSSLNKSFYRVVLGIVIAVVFLFGVSYAYFSRTLFGQKTYSIVSGGLKVSLDEKTADNITLMNARPVTDEVGRNNPAYQFSLINEDKEDLEYTIYLSEEEIENKTPTSAIRYQYTRDIDHINITRSMEESKTEEGRFYLESGMIPSNTTYQYSFKMWIDIHAGNEIMGTEYSLKIQIEAVQTIPSIYKETILNGCDPVLSDNLVPVVIEENGTVKKANLKQRWYSYSNQEWANAVVLEDKTQRYDDGQVIPEANIQSYFVWIPRYKYKLFDMGNYTSLTTVKDSVQTIDIVFENKTVTPSVGTKVGDYHSHPAFQVFESNGFWVGKFESGYKGATSTAGAEQNNSDSANLIIKPNVYSWRNISVGNAFKVSYDYLRSDESHMMKNTEWGAVAYLQHSEYGSRTSVRVNNNWYYLTGYVGVAEPTLGWTQTSVEGNLIGSSSDVTRSYNTDIGYTASTTGNISGIYDMAGGAWDYVMGYNNQASTLGGSSELGQEFFTSKEWEKYYDKYSSTVNTLYNSRILGDATGEMGPFVNKEGIYASNWYGDYGYFLETANSWFCRGSAYSDGVTAGIFAFAGANGGAAVEYSFRVVINP